MTMKVSVMTYVYVAAYLVIMPTSLADILIKVWNFYLRNFGNTKDYRFIFLNSAPLWRIKNCMNPLIL